MKRTTSSTAEVASATDGAPGRRGLSRHTTRWIQTVILAVVALAWVYPLLWIVSASVKDAMGIFSSGLSLWPETWHWDNYSRAWDEAGFARYMLNSIIVTVGTVAIVVVRCAAAGYVIARYRFVGRRLLVGVLAATMFIPTGLFIVPVVELSDLLGLLNSHLGLILALAGGGHVAAVLLYAGFYAQVPKELEEAALMDGAGFLRTFFRIMLPLSGPITATVVVLTFLATWNNFFLPLVFTFSVPQNRTLAVGMLAFEGTNSTDWSGLAAAASLSLLPILLLFIVLQRHFVEGIAGAVKN
ncbi:carbohydrate ABC transporter permease [Ruania alba]|uniref:Carbohydrate ABC transporter membrane protein 2, CUT1 family n=1 Tax=Ruania alba TaxID=648782 RepID=A0A1H5HMP4_9MICO|nr:carbohydrate ABC transporter permease [Ruania alba]SEE29044.1 carbohydrate ABC transporter membrane protein 2, CUT1 family [Ruania alba]